MNIKYTTESGMPFHLQFLFTSLQLATSLLTTHASVSCPDHTRANEFRPTCSVISLLIIIPHIVFSWFDFSREYHENVSSYGM